jgi:hypothetical protein
MTMTKDVKGLFEAITPRLTDIIQNKNLHVLATKTGPNQVEFVTTGGAPFEITSSFLDQLQTYINIATLLHNNDAQARSHPGQSNK